MPKLPRSSRHSSKSPSFSFRRLASSWLWLFGSFCAFVTCQIGLRAQEHAASPSEITEKDREFFEKKVRPVFAACCWECHGPDSQEGELRLDSATAALQGGSRGSAWIPGFPEKSLVISAINHADTLQMPPKEKLPPATIADLTDWVRRGAPWPAAANAPPAVPRVAKPTAVESPLTDDQRRFWAFQTPLAVAIPDVHDPHWTCAPVDRFVLRSLNDKQLSPAAPTERRTLVRRATFDLCGVPPTPDEARDFLADDSPDAYVRLLDRLLASPRYGERWGRHWLDVARYGDSNGLDENLAFANAYRYRDYVIGAFNQDKPYDQFVREQLAGDLLPLDGDPNDPALTARQSEQLTATGFLVIGAKMLAEDDPVKMQMDLVDEQVDTIGKAFLGLTVGCARCHDHKFDPLSMADYYGLAGIFKSTKTMENFSVVARWQERPLATPVELERLKAQQSQLDTLRQALARELAEHTEQLTDQVRQQAGRYLLAAARQLSRDEHLQSAKSWGAVRQANPGAVPPEYLQVIEAEDYVRGNALRMNTGYGEGIGVILNAGPLPNVAEYEVQIASADFYQIELRYAAAEARPVVLSINGQVVKSDAAAKATGSWNPDTQQWAVEGFYPLRAGKNVIRLERAQPFPHLDKLLLVPAPAAVRQLAEVAPSNDAYGPVATPADAAPLHDAYVRQWAELLKRTRSQADSPFAEWHAHARRFSGEPAAPLPTARIIPGDPPQTWQELAMQYGLAIRETHAAWQTLKATDAGRDAGRDAKALPDARLEAIRALLHDPQGPLAHPKNLEEYFAAATRDSLAKQRAAAQQVQDSLPKFPEVMSASEGQAADLRIHLRGNHTSLGAAAPRRAACRVYWPVPRRRNSVRRRAVAASSSSGSCDPTTRSPAECW